MPSSLQRWDRLLCMCSECRWHRDECSHMTCAAMPIPLQLAQGWTSCSSVKASHDGGSRPLVGLKAIRKPYSEGKISKTYLHLLGVVQKVHIASQNASQNRTRSLHSVEKSLIPRNAPATAGQASSGSRARCTALAIFSASAGKCCGLPSQVP